MWISANLSPGEQRHHLPRGSRSQCDTEKASELPIRNTQNWHAELRLPTLLDVPDQKVRKRHGGGVANQGAGQLRLMDTRQASAPLGSMLMSILEASIESTCHPSRKLALISSWVTRLGPQLPGWRSLKHSM